MNALFMKNKYNLVENLGLNTYFNIRVV